MADWQGHTPTGTPGGMGGAGYGGQQGGQQGAQQGGPRGAQPPAPGAMGQARDAVQHLAGEAKQQAGQRLESGIERGKSRAADTLGGVAHTLLQSGRQLREQQQPGAEYVERAGQQVQRLSDHLQRTDVHQLVDQVEAVARRQPALFLGGMFALGVIGARFLRSSRRAAEPQGVDARVGADAFAGYGAPGVGASGFGTSGYGAAGYGAAAPSFGTPDYGATPSYGTPSTPSYGTHATPSYGTPPTYGSTGATPSFGAGGGYGATDYGTRDYGANANTDPYGTAGTAGSAGTGGTTPRDRDVTARQPVANEPPYGVGGSPSPLGQESFRRADDQRPGGLDPRGSEQP